MLETAGNLDGLVIDIVLVGFKLGTGVYSLASLYLSILMQDGNDRTALGLNNTSSSDNGQKNYPDGYRCH